MKIIERISDGLESNSYLLVSGGESAAVDPSEDAGWFVSESLHCGAEVRYIILTHGHYDHMLALGELRSLAGAPLLIGEGDSDCLADPHRSLFRMAWGRNTVFDPAERTLRDGDRITLGEEEIRVISTPGHTPGSCCFLFDRGIVTGDTLFDMSVGRCDFPGGNECDLRSSLGKLAQLDRDLTIYPGHGPTSTLERQIMFNPFMNGEL